jgi:hypothetical protein
MKASECTFEHMMRVASGLYELAETTSYLQVEYGLSELKACWDGFIHTSDAYCQEFKSRKQICVEFAHALGEYIEYLEESSPIEMGQ